MRCCRRKFLCTSGAIAGGAMLAGCASDRIIPETGLLLPRENALPQGLIVAKGSDVRVMARAAVNELGGLGNLVETGDTVLVKPNIAWNRTPEQAANTNPELVAELVVLAKEAGAGEVIVLDHSCADPRESYRNSGIESAARDAGARVIFVRGAEDRRFGTLSFPDGKVTKSWPVHDVVALADVLINVPIVKHHVLSEATAGLKNMMGLAGGKRGDWHTDLANRICDISQRIRVDLTVVDGYRVMLRNGPTGGSLDDVAERHTIAVSTDRVASDAFGVTLLDMNANDIPAIVEAAARGMGTMDLSEVDVAEISV